MGGGPAGATAATLVAEQGFRVALLERERTPPFKVGESLVPYTYETFARLGIVERLKEEPLPEKAQRPVLQPPRAAVRPPSTSRKPIRTSAPPPGRCGAASSTRCCSRTRPTGASRSTRASRCRTSSSRTAGRSGFARDRPTAPGSSSRRGSWWTRPAAPHSSPASWDSRSRSRTSGRSRSSATSGAPGATPAWTRARP